MSTTKYAELNSFLRDEISKLEASREKFMPYGPSVERIDSKIESFKQVLGWISRHDEERQPAPGNLTRLIRNLRNSVWYNGADRPHGDNFFTGWVTACNTILSLLGSDPMSKD